MNKYLDAEKALEAVLYVSGSTTDLFHIVKTLYFADKMHLEKYGTLMTGDYYVAMPDGPVPSGAYDLIKYARGDDFAYEKKISDVRPDKALEVKGEKKDVVIRLREPNLDYLSESDRECLDSAIERYAAMDWRDLWNIVHAEESYRKAKSQKPEKKNASIPLGDIIILDVPNGADVIRYLES